MAKAKILLAEDDINLGSVLKQYLNAKNYDVELSIDGEDAFKNFMENEYDLCILDVMMPKKDGFTLAKDIRRINSKIPIIFLTVRSMKEDVLKGFEIGADDYITKPFNMEELLMRIEAILRRTGRLTESKQTVFQIGKFTFDSVRQTLKIGDKVRKLTTKENELLKLLASNMNEVVERNYALKLVWGDDSFFNARSMDVYITKLRKYLADDPSVKIINVHSVGFKLITNAEDIS
jgi:DNA-binding response OmpR family regulator